MSVMLYPCMLCVALLMCLFVLCVACLIVLIGQIKYPTSTQKLQNELVLFVERESSSQNQH